MLSSLTGLLKTGMNPIQALDAAAKGLEEGSLCKAEVELMIERLRFGVSEDKSIGAFGEDIYHPEIELFVQALLLSRRVGGNLSDTLERLARQVRKRQYFRSSARASISMQKGSIWFIIAVLVFMEVYIYIMYPEAIVDSINDPMGWQVWQGAILVVLLGIFWIRQVTKIRI
jgi:tight adherence protein B